MPVPGVTTLNWLNACWPQRRKPKRSRLRANSISTFLANASGRPNTSATTEWSMTSSAGMSGLILVGGELDLGARIPARVPLSERVDVIGGDVGAVLVAEQVLQQDLEAEWEGLRSFRRVQPVDFVLPAC